MSSPVRMEPLFKLKLSSQLFFSRKNHPKSLEIHCIDWRYSLLECCTMWCYAIAKLMKVHNLLKTLFNTPAVHLVVEKIHKIHAAGKGDSNFILFLWTDFFSSKNQNTFWQEKIYTAIWKGYILTKISRYLTSNGLIGHIIVRTWYQQYATVS